MPGERRDILFSLPEIHSILIPHARRIPDVPLEIKDYSLIEAAHTHELGLGLRDRTERFLNSLPAPPNSSGIIFRATRASILRKADVAFFAPETILLAMLIENCAALHIALPRAGRKQLFTEDFHVRMRIRIEGGKSCLTLEDP